MEDHLGFEPRTDCLRGSCSAIELMVQHGAPEGNRTPNLDVRTVLLYPLSYRGIWFKGVIDGTRTRKPLGPQPSALPIELRSP
ncbi:MAG: hypothetical protein CEN88_373 [Candidatus Berkelbacteria bacterium Licking1014_2]|uniref:Uncharacterized protein n=1 Tax=Candidatus Berkelbacteria bacterium Licking1014_2 TaxID=2017146 RepID=A0A554LTW6_9BACT|nr:MAG: hypothetical protein CEN88_373 [Candidatus Berkelbacteria bacterium Licking1014_2]